MGREMEERTLFAVSFTSFTASWTLSLAVDIDVVSSEPLCYKLIFKNRKVDDFK